MKKNIVISEATRSTYGIDVVDLSDFPSEFASQIYCVLSLLQQKYPEVVQRINRLSSIQTYNRHSYDLGYGIQRVRKDTYAKSYGGGKWRRNGQICVNRYWLSNYDKFKQQCEQNEREGYFAKGTGTPLGVFVHEFGHQVYYYLEYIGIEDKIVGDFFGKVYLKKRITAELSRSATQNVDEFFAEAFAEYMLNPDRSAISIAVISYLDSVLKHRREA